MKFPILVVFVGIAGCSSSKSQIGPDGTLPDGGTVAQATPGTDGTSGTRLKARTYTAEDGAQQFIGWFDSQRNENCGFGMAADGKIRCLPGGAGTLPGFFGDSGCSQPVLTVAVGCTPPATVQSTVTDGASCGALPATKILSVGAKHAGGTFRGAPGSCINNTLPVSAGDLYETGAEIPASSFVAATEGHQ